ncbi:MAG: hypothetical protein ACTH2Q_14410 [Propionibacteriaceae bacterium]
MQQDVAAPDADGSHNPWRTASRRGDGQRILFGVSYEDERIELDAFADASRVCLVATSGEVVAACAAAGLDVVAVDLNQAQLDYARERVAGGSTRRGSAQLVMDTLRQGLTAVAPAWRPRHLVPHLLHDDGPAARKHWDETLDSRAFRAVLKASLQPGLRLGVIARPELFGFLPPRFHRVIRQRMADGLERHGMAGNRFAWRLLAGRELPGWQLPAVDADALTWQVADMAAHLETVPAGSYDGVSLSNVVDGMPNHFARRLLVAARHAVKRGGPIVWRTFSNPGLPGAGRVADEAAMVWGQVQVEAA